jgi:Tol biopolymer transport system component
MNRFHIWMFTFVAVTLLASCVSNGDETSIATESTTGVPPTTTTILATTSPPTTVPPTTLLPATTLPPPTAVVAPGEEWIVYQHGTGLREEVYVVRPNGSGAHSLAHQLDGSNQTNPDWSPDGSRVVFAVTGNGGRDDLWTVDADGTDPMMLLDCMDECVWFDDPAWSPDGAKVVYARMAESGGGGGVGTLETVDVASGSVTVLATGTGNDFFAGPRWSPDGRAIVAEVVHRSDPSVFADVVGVTLSVFDLAGPAPVVRPLTEPSLFAATADWSPDGATIVYSALPTDGAAAPDLFTIRPDGSGPTRLTRLVESGTSAVQPTFTIDGHDIVFVGAPAPGDDDQLLTVSVDGGEVTTATDTVVNGHHPRIRPSSGT